MLYVNSRLSFRVWHSLSRRFCDKVCKSSADDLKDERVEKKNEASKKLSSLLETLTIEAQNVPVDKSTNNITLNLAKPSVKNKRLLKPTKPPSELETEIRNEDENQEDVEAIEPELVSAARTVAKDLGGDVHRTQSELIEKLRAHARETIESRDRKKVLPARGARISERLFEGMKFDIKTPTEPRLTKKPSRGIRVIAGTKVKDGIKEPKSKLLQGQLSDGEKSELNIKIPTASHLTTGKKPSRDIQVMAETEIKEPKSKLLQAMRAHMNGEGQLPDGEKIELNVSQLFVGVKIDRTKEPERKRGEMQMSPDDRRHTFRQYPAFSQVRGDPFEPIFREDRPTLYGDAQRVNLFGGSPLNIFKLEKEVKPSDGTGPVLETWDHLQAHELSLIVDHTPKNAYEEMIEWTEQGKFWKFPIDNEQGLEEEMKIGFEEHIFLEPLLDGFPEKGPVRHFMELVTVGLSKNPYITVQRKREHIDWFRQYFKEKEALLKETGTI